MSTEQPITVGPYSGHIKIETADISYGAHRSRRKVLISATGTFKLVGEGLDSLGDFEYNNEHDQLHIKDARIWPDQIDPLNRQKFARYIKTYIKQEVKEALQMGLQDLI